MAATQQTSSVGAYNIVTQMIKKRVGNQTFYKPPNGGPNPIDTSPQAMLKRSGLFSIMLQDAVTLYTWYIEVEGGYFTDVEAQRNYFFHVGSNINCTVETPVINYLTITTPSADSGGRTYTIFLSKYFDQPPTIQQTSSNTFTGNVYIQISDYIATTSRRNWS